MVQILFVPGIKGTELFEKERKVWFPKNSGDIASLSIHNDLTYGNPVRIVNAFQLSKVEVYKGVMDEFGPEEIDFFTYDWRKDIRNHTDRLVRRIVELAGDGQIILVAHSMGGMLAKLALLKLEELNITNKVSKLITLGTPWHGSPDSYKAITYGEPGIYPRLYHLHNYITDKDSRSLARQFPSVYQLLPSESYFYSEEGRFILSDREEELVYNDVLQKIQQEYHKTDCDPIDVFNTYMRPVQEAMLRPLPPGVIHDCLIGTSNPTIYQLPESPAENVPVLERILFKKDVIFKNGDGVVPIFSAKPAHEANLFYLPVQHHEMASNQNVLEFIRWSITGYEGLRPNSILDKPNEKLNSGVMAKFKCPIDTTILDENGKYLAGEFDPSIEEVSPLLENETIHYFGIGDSKYVFFPELPEKDITVTVNSYHTGIADISVDYFNPEIAKKINFEPLPVSQGDVAIVKIPLGNNLDEASLKTKNGEELTVTVSELPTDTIRIQNPIGKLELTIKKAPGHSKSSHRPVYSGAVDVDIKYLGDDIENIYFTIDKELPIIYSEENRVINLGPGEHTVRAFAKDVYGRPLKPRQASFTVDNVPPITKLISQVKPGIIEFSLEAKTLGSRSSTFFRTSIDGNDEWISFDPKQENVIHWEPRQQEIIIEYYSSNEFGFQEAPKSVSFRLGNIPALMWDDNPAVVTPAQIWNILLRNNGIQMNSFTPVFLGRTNQETNFGERAPDDIKGIRFVNELHQIDVMYAEKYSLYFVKPPTEVLEVGQTSTFSFELLTDRTSERVTHTNPRAKLHPLRAGNMPDTHLAPLVERNGIFHGQFIVGNAFLDYKHKLIITDSRNSNPALREITLIMKENEEEEAN